MRVLIIPHYINFDLSNKSPANVFPTMLLKALVKAGHEYEIGKFSKNYILEAVHSTKCNFIINFEEASPRNATKFMEGDPVDAVDKMFKTLEDIEKIVPIYPPVRLLQLIKSKTYLTKLSGKTLMFMPGTQTFLFYKTTVHENIIKVLTKFETNQVSDIVFKFGYSGDSEHIFRYNLSTIMIPDITNQLINVMHGYRNECGRAFLVIAQPFNPIISNRLNEYRCFFSGDIMSPIAAFGFTTTPQNTRIYIPSVWLNPKTPQHAEIITLAKYGMAMVTKYIGFAPPALRVDVSWVIQPDKTRRYYINEIEGLSGTYYFKIPHTPANYPIRLTDIYDCYKRPYPCVPYPKIVPQKLADTLVNYIQTYVES